MLYEALDPDGKSCTPDAFIKRYGATHREDGNHPLCPRGCRVLVAGIGGTKSPMHFRHYPGSDCPFAGNDRFNRMLKGVSWDREQGERLLKAFCEERNLVETYNLLKTLFRLSDFHPDEFYHLCRQAQRRRIWWYCGITLEIVPYVMAALRDVRCHVTDNGETDANDPKERFSMRAVLHPPRGCGLRPAWEEPGSCRLNIHFVDDGRVVRELRHSPVRVPDPQLESSREDIGWILARPRFVEKIKWFCRERSLYND